MFAQAVLRSTPRSTVLRPLTVQRLPRLSPTRSPHSEPINRARLRLRAIRTSDITRLPPSARPRLILPLGAHHHPDDPPARRRDLDELDSNGHCLGSAELAATGEYVAESRTLLWVVWPGFRSPSLTRTAAGWPGVLTRQRRLCRQPRLVQDRGQLDRPAEHRPMPGRQLLVAPPVVGHVAVQRQCRGHPLHLRGGEA
jgi:hypothetical protein